MHDKSDTASIRTTATTFSMRSIRLVVPSFQDALKTSRAYKRLYRRGGLSSGESILSGKFSIQSSEKGCSWSMLSDLSLGELSISEISVIELPIYPSDLWDAKPYLEATASTTSSRRKSSTKVKWSTRGRMHNAIASGNEYVVRTLLALGCDVEELDRQGRTPLVHAVVKGREAIAKLLLQKGAYTEARNDQGETPLTTAVRENQLATAKLLLDGGADIETRDTENRTPLVHAVAEHREAIIELLLQKGADTEARNNRGETPLTIAVNENQLATVSILLDTGADMEARDNENRTPLTRAVIRDDQALVNLLLENGADMEVRDDQNQTPLAHAIRNDCYGIAAFLVENGANFEVLTALGWTTNDRDRLRSAIESGNENVVRLLFAMGADLEERDGEGKTLLEHAILNDQYGFAAFLVEKGANFEVLTALGWTTNDRDRLRSAIKSGNENVVRLLLAMGADLEERDGEGKTPLAHAALNNQDAIVKLLWEKGANLTALGSTINVNGRLRGAIDSGSENVVRLLLALGADLEERMGNYNMTSLLFAADKGKLAIVKLLLEKGADMNARDEDGWTVLHWAVFSGDAGMLQILLDNGALHLIDVTETSNEPGDTPLHKVAWDDSRLAVGQMLVERGASVNPKNDNGVTPYQVARLYSPAVAKYLWSQLSPEEQAAETPPRE
jgi:ankyrin repeat protein